MRRKPTLPRRPPSNRLSRRRQRLNELLEEHGQIIDKLASSPSMIMGSFYMVYKTCSKPGCRCRGGKPHGPFPALSYSIKGKHKQRVVRQEDAPEVQRRASAYRDFKRRLRRLRAIHAETEKIVESIRSALTEVYE